MSPILATILGSLAPLATLFFVVYKLSKANQSALDSKNSLIKSERQVGELTEQVSSLARENTLLKDQLSGEISARKVVTAQRDKLLDDLANLGDTKAVVHSMNETIKKIAAWKK